MGLSFGRVNANTTQTNSKEMIELIEFRVSVEASIPRLNITNKNKSVEKSTTINTGKTSAEKIEIIPEIFMIKRATIRLIIKRIRNTT